MAAAVVSVAHRHGLDVPRDLSVVGFDDTSAATTVWPELTTIHQPIASMADSAIDVLLRDIRRKDRTTRLLADHVVAHALVTRDSVAPPKRPSDDVRRIADGPKPVLMLAGSRRVGCQPRGPLGAPPQPSICSSSLPLVS